MFQRVGIIEDHPLLGIGENAFPQVAQRYGLLLENSRATYEHAHNIPLTIAVELGLVGFAILLWLTVALAQVLMHAYRRSHRDHRGMVIAVAAAFVALALQGMVDYTLRLAVIVAVIFMLAGCAVVLARGREGDEVGAGAQAAAVSR